MPKVTFLPAALSCEVPAGASLMEAAARAGAPIDAECGGEGVCGRCLVTIRTGLVDPGGPGCLPAEALERGLVLACKARVLDGDIEVETGGVLDRSGAQFAETGLEAAAALLPPPTECEPPTVRFAVRVPEPQLEDGLSDLDRLRTSDARLKEARVPLSVLRRLADSLRAEEGLVTVTAARDGEGLAVVDVEPGDRAGRFYGLAVDVGTTSVAVEIVDLATSRVLVARSGFNAQVSRGLDIIGRINYARRPERLDELRGLVLETINSLAREAARSRGIDPAEIAAAVLAGNTTMVHLLLGLPPERIRLEPYTPTVLMLPTLPAADVGLAIRPEARVYTSPSVASYVGGDIVAGLLATELAGDREELSLFLDIGTNGELVLGSRDFLVCCACSAGPAFEGGGIGCGMPAATGAIDRVSVDPATGCATFTTIGGAPPAGICGSGIISLLAGLFLAGWLDPAGRLDRSGRCRCIEVDGKRARYRIEGTDFVIDETDIESVLRAKAAIHCAVKLLLSSVGLGLEMVETFYIAGGFGRYMNLEDAVTLGLLPDIERSRFRYVGNSSLAGARLALVSKDHRRLQSDLAGRMTCIELMTSREYMDEYTAALFLPHTDSTLFPSVRPASRRSTS